MFHICFVLYGRISFFFTSTTIIRSKGSIHPYRYHIQSTALTQTNVHIFLQIIFPTRYAHIQSVKESGSAGVVISLGLSASSVNTHRFV